MKTALIFNEESLVSGRKLRFILKNNFLLNATPITLGKLTEYSAEFQLPNQYGITKYKYFKDSNPSDSQDLTLNLIMLPIIVGLQICIQAKPKNLVRKDFNLTN